MKNCQKDKILKTGAIVLMLLGALYFFQIFINSIFLIKEVYATIQIERKTSQEIKKIKQYQIIQRGVENV